MANNSEIQLGLVKRIIRRIIGPPRDVHDRSIFRRITLIPLLAWIGLGADGLSSSAYGPEEAFRALGSHVYLSVFLGLATALTVFIISYAYSRIIEHFPHGGGGYVVATHMLGSRAGVISGCALLVDYVLTIAISVASSIDALFSFIPMHYHPYKLAVECGIIILLIVLNIRGVKESILVLAPIFIVFFLTHIVLLLYGIGSRIPEFGPISLEVYGNFRSDLTALGGAGLLAIFLRAYSLGGGTYTGIEAVSNGLQILREPTVQTGKRTMLYMAGSLAFTALGLFFCYLLFRVVPVHGKTLNAVLADSIFGQWPYGGGIALVTILSEGALLIVAAQAGFADGPRVIANMAVDSWFPHRFSSLSQRLTTGNGVVAMGISALLALLYTHGKVDTLVVMYSINVFLTFSLSEFGMSRFFFTHRRKENKWAQHLSVHMTGLTLCLTILSVTVYEKFAEGGWMTLVITAVVIGVCYVIRSHYDEVLAEKNKLDKYLIDIPTNGEATREPVNPKNRTAIQLVSGFNGFGVHTFFSIVRNFPKLYKNIIFVSVALIDSGSFKGRREVENLEQSVKDSLKKYADLARKLGLPAEYRMATGTDVVETAATLCTEVSKEFPDSTVFTGQLTFKLEKFYHRLLHNETAFAVQRHLQWNGITTVILPIRLDI